MKHLIILTIVLLLNLFNSLSAQNSDYQTGETLRINESDTLYGNTWLAGNLIEVLGFIDNDLFAAGKQIFLEGNITDDAFVAGSNISFRGEIGDMLISAGETIVIDGTVHGDLFSFGSDVHITNEGHIQGNAVVMGANVSFDGGTIDGWLRVGGENIRLDGQVGLYTEIWSKDVTFGNAYSAGYSTTINSDEAVYKENLGIAPDDLVINIKEKNFWAYLVGKLWAFVSILITGMVLFRSFPKQSTDLHRFARESFWLNTGIGLLSLIFIPILVAVLLGLVLTIPLGILLGISYLTALFISYILVAMIIGVKILEIFNNEHKNSTYYWGIFIGMILVSLFVNIPYAGWLINILLIFYGLGSIVNYLVSIRRSKENTAIS